RRQQQRHRSHSEELHVPSLLIHWRGDDAPSILQSACASMIVRKAVFGAAPTTRSTISPSFTNKIVGIDRIPYRAASPGFSSMLTFIDMCITNRHYGHK